MAISKFVYLVPVLTLYFINLVSSDKLDIKDVYDSVYHKLEYTENGMTTTKIYPTNDQPIKQLYDGQNLLWCALLNERANLITIIKFKYSGEVIVKIDIDFPVSKPQKIYCNRKGNYQEISQKILKEKIKSFSTIQKYDPSKIYQPKTEEYPIPHMPQTRHKRRSELPKHLRSKHKRRKYVTPLNEDTETSSETEEIIKSRIKEIPEPSTDRSTSHTTGSPSNTITHSDGLEVNVHGEKRIKKSKTKMCHASTQVLKEELEPEVIPLEISSDSDVDVDESTDPQVMQSDAVTQTDTEPSESVSVSIQTDFKGSYEEPTVKTSSTKTQTHKQKTTSAKTQTSVTVKEKSTQTVVQTKSKLTQTETQGDIQTDIAETQTETQTDKQTDTDKGSRDPSTLPLKKRPYKPE